METGAGIFGLDGFFGVRGSVDPPIFREEKAGGMLLLRKSRRRLSSLDVDKSSLSAKQIVDFFFLTTAGADGVDGGGAASLMVGGVNFKEGEDRLVATAEKALLGDCKSRGDDSLKLLPALSLDFWRAIGGEDFAVSA